MATTDESTCLVATIQIAEGTTFSEQVSGSAKLESGGASTSSLRHIKAETVYGDGSSPSSVATRILTRATAHIALALTEGEDELAQLTELEYALSDIHEAGTIRTGSQFFDALLTAIEVAVREHRGVAYSARELIALESVCRELSLTSRPGQESFVRLLGKLEDSGLDLGLSLFPSADDTYS